MITRLAGVEKLVNNRSGGNSTYNKSATVPVTDTDERLKAGQAVEPESEMQSSASAVGTVASIESRTTDFVNRRLPSPPRLYGCLRSFVAGHRVPSTAWDWRAAIIFVL